MPNEDSKILKYNQGEKSLKAPAIIYADLECLLKKSIHVKIIMKNFTQREKLSICLLVGYSLFTSCSFDATENKLGCYRGKGCMERFCRDLRDHAMKYYEEKEMILLTDKENKSYEQQKVCYICKKNLVLIKMIKMYLNYTIKSEIIVIALEN